MVFGLEVIDPLLDPPTKKLAFVSIFFSFAFALFLLNRKHKRKTFDSIPNCSWWEPLLLIFTGAYNYKWISKNIKVLTLLEVVQYFQPIDYF